MNFFRENLPLKIASLALAVGVWAYIRGEDKPVQIFAVPLDLQNLPSNLTVVGEVEETVNVRVRAPESILRNMGNETLLASVDLEGFTTGEQFVRVSRELMRVPPGVEVIQIDPELIRLRLEKKVQRDLPVVTRIVGEPSPGYVLGETRVQPPRSRVEGPESVLKDAVEVGTDPIRIDGRSQPFEAVVQLYPDRPKIQVLGGRTAVVSVNIHEQYVTRTLEGVEVRGEGAPLQVQLDPATVEVTLEGTPTDLAALDEGALSAVVDLGDIPEGQKRARLEPRIVFDDQELDGRVFVRVMTPEAISIRVLKRPDR